MASIVTARQVNDVIIGITTVTILDLQGSLLTISKGLNSYQQYVDTDFVH